MSSRYISKDLREKVFKVAQYRCGYCLTPQRLVGPILEIDHLIPVSLGGTSEEKNLWVACPNCNGGKSSRIEVIDPLSADSVPLFNPRQDNWEEHFVWSDEGTKIIGISAIGRATVTALKMNRPENIVTRELWVAVGWHPPKN